MRRFVILVLALASLLAAVPASAEDPPVRTPLTPMDITPPHSEWYGLYMKGSKTGWLRLEFGQRGEGASGVYFGSAVGELHMKAMDQQVVVFFEELSEFDVAPPFAYRGGRGSVKQAGGGRETVITRTEKGYSAKVTAGGVTRDLPIEGVDYTLADVLTPERWMQAGRAPGDKLRVRSFSSEKLKMGADQFTILTVNDAVVEGVKTTWYDVNQFSEVSRQESLMRFDSSGLMLSLVMGGAIEARLESESVAKRLEQGGDVFVQGFAKIDKPMGDPAKVRRLVLAVDGAPAARLKSGPRQSVARDEKTGTVTLTLGAEVAGDSVTAADLAESLTETVDYPIKLRDVTALAAQAVGDAKTPKEKVDRLVQFVGGYVEDKYSPNLDSVPEIITKRSGDCSEHSLLFVTLARAAGIPARQVSGLAYMGDKAMAFGGHAWDEVVLDGRWVPVDPTFKETEINPTHIAIDRGDVSADMMHTMGELSFRLVDVQLAK